MLGDLDLPIPNLPPSDAKLQLKFQLPVIESWVYLLIEM
jgi:hypothetical protein